MSTSFIAKLIAASLLATPVAASAAETGASQAAAAAPASKNTASTEEKKICKQLDLSGSRLPRRACLTAKQWKQVQDDVER